MYYYNGSVYVEDDDQCGTCSNFNQGVACPLLQALGMGLVVLKDSMAVINCGFYKEFKRHLHLISNNLPNSSDDNDDNTNNLKQFKH